MKSIKYIGLSVVITLGLGLNGCGDSEDDSGDSAVSSGIKRASSLVAEDFTPAETNLTKAEFIASINDTSKFFFTDPSPTSTEGTCVINLLKDKFQISAVGDGTYKAEIAEIDAVSCFSGSGFTKLAYSFYIDGLDSPTFQFADSNILKSRMLAVFEGTFISGGNTYDMHSYIAQTAYNFNDPCISADPIQCKDLTKTVMTSAAINYDRSTTVYLTADDLGFTDRNDSYFNSGSIDFTISNWRGTMSYSDADTTPTYTANSATETVSGTFAYTP